MELPMLTEYFTLQQRIFALFGYKEDWRGIPLIDETNAYWMLDQDPDGSGFVAWAYQPWTEKLIREGLEVFDGKIYTRRHLPQWVYSTPTHTMVCVDTMTDGNKFLMIFSYERRCLDDALIRLYKETWGTGTY